jgi:hypothetical protein
VVSQADQEKEDHVEISAIKEELRGSLLSIASKLLSNEHLRLHHLSKAEQQLWNSFEKADIYKFLTGEKDCIPEFQLNWTSPETPAICWSALPVVPAQAVQQQPQPAAPTPALLQWPFQFHHRLFFQRPLLSPVAADPTAEVPQPPKVKILTSDRVLRE